MNAATVVGGGVDGGAASFPDYVLEGGKAFPNDEAQALRARYTEMRKEIERLDGMGVAAVIGGLFQELPWLEGFTMDFNCSSEMSDEGGSFLSVNMNISEVKFVQGVPLEDAAGNEIDELEVEDLIDQALENDVYWVMESLGTVEDGSELSVAVSRPASLRGGLDSCQGRLGGASLLKEMLPEKAAELGVV